MAGESQTGILNRLRELNLPVVANWMLAGAYQLAGLGDVANSITQNMVRVSEDYRELSYTYGSGLRDDAIILQTLVLMNRKQDGLELMKKLSAALSDDEWWMSTQETSFALMAVTAFAGKEEKAGKISFDYMWNNNKKISASTSLPFIQQPLPLTSETGSKLSLNNTGEGNIYVRLIQEGIPTHAVETENSNSLSIIVTYNDANGNLLDISHLKQGAEFTAEVSVSNPGMKGDYEQLALSQIFSSGFEIINERLADEGINNNLSDKAEYQDIRDDRVYTFFDLSANSRKIFKIKLVATYAGKFYQPGVYCEAMYDHSINARSKGQWIEITPGVTE